MKHKLLLELLELVKGTHVDSHEGEPNHYYRPDIIDCNICLKIQQIEATDE